jgi:hypothetical protein
MFDGKSLANLVSILNSKDKRDAYKIYIQGLTMTLAIQQQYITQLDADIEYMKSCQFVVNQSGGGVLNYLFGKKKKETHIGTRKVEGVDRHEKGRFEKRINNWMKNSEFAQKYIFNNRYNQEKLLSERQSWKKWFGEMMKKMNDQKNKLMSKRDTRYNSDEAKQFLEEIGQQEADIERLEKIQFSLAKDLELIDKDWKTKCEDLKKNPGRIDMWNVELKGKHQTPTSSSSSNKQKPSMPSKTPPPVPFKTTPQVHYSNPSGIPTYAPPPIPSSKKMKMEAANKMKMEAANKMKMEAANKIQSTYKNYKRNKTQKKQSKKSSSKPNQLKIANTTENQSSRSKEIDSLERKVKSNYAEFRHKLRETLNLLDGLKPHIPIRNLPPSPTNNPPIPTNNSKPPSPTNNILPPKPPSRNNNNLLPKPPSRNNNNLLPKPPIQISKSNKSKSNKSKSNKSKSNKIKIKQRKPNPKSIDEIVSTYDDGSQIIKTTHKNGNTEFLLKDKSGTTVNISDHKR